MGNRRRALCALLACVLLGSTTGVHVAAESETPMQLVQRLVQAIIRTTPTHSALSAAEQAATPPWPRRRTLSWTSLR